MSKQDTRQDIVNLAQDLIQKRGYNAFSYQDLSEGLKITKASIHYHFESKEDLGTEVVEGAVERFRKWVRALPVELSPSEKIDQYIDNTNIWGKGKICLGGITQAEWNTLPKKMKAVAEEMTLERRAWVTAVLAEGQKSGHFKRSSSPEEQALFIGSAVQGALQMARAQDNPKIFEIVAKQIKELIKK